MSFVLRDGSFSTLTCMFLRCSLMSTCLRIPHLYLRLQVGVYSPMDVHIMSSDALDYTCFALLCCNRTLAHIMLMFWLVHVKFAFLYSVIAGVSDYPYGRRIIIVFPVCNRSTEDCELQNVLFDSPRDFAAVHLHLDTCSTPGELGCACYAALLPTVLKAPLAQPLFHGPPRS